MKQILLNTVSIQDTGAVEDVAAEYGERVERVRSMVQWAEPGDEEAGPEELITAAWLDPEADRRALVGRLSGITYTDDLWAPRGMDGRLPGTWDDVRFGWLEGMLHDAEYEEIKRRRGGLLPHPKAGKYGTEAPGE